jgi:hypothetical protein
MRFNIVIMEGSLRYGYNVPQMVWKDASGAWHHQETPAFEALQGAQTVLAGGQPVTDAIAAELIAAGIGTLTPL